MSKFVGKHPCQLILVAHHCYHLPRNIDSSAGNRKSVSNGQIRKYEIESNLRSRQVGRNPVSKALEKRCYFLILNHTEAAIDLLCSGITQILFLFRTKNVSGINRRGNRQHALRSGLCRGGSSKRAQKHLNNSNSAHDRPPTGYQMKSWREGNTLRNGSQRRRRYSGRLLAYHSQVRRKPSSKLIFGS